MQSSTATTKIKWPKDGLSDPLKFRLYYPPVHRPKKAQQWDNWAQSMSMDTRFSGAERSILIQIALHYNLKTGDCFPSKERIAVFAGLGNGETGKKAVQRAVSKAVELGWLERISRNGGAREKSQTNQYGLTLPLSIQRVLSNTGPELAVAQVQGEWQVVQMTDGIAICGPFKSKASAKRWLAEHGPTGQMKGERLDKSRVATGQIEGSDWTNRGGRLDISTPHNLEVLEQGILEQGSKNPSTEVEARKRAPRDSSSVPDKEQAEIERLRLREQDPKHQQEQRERRARNEAYMREHPEFAKQLGWDGNA